MGGAKPGRRYVNQVFPVRNETALEEKRKLDKRLIRAVGDSLELVRAAREQGQNGSSVVGHATDRCGTCGSFMRADWVQCPFHLPGQKRPLRTKQIIEG